MDKNKINKVLKIIILILLVIVIILGIVLFVKKTKWEVIIDSSCNNIEINKEINVYECIKEIKNGKVVSEDKKIDTSIVGKQDIKLTIMNMKKKYDYSFSINVVDTEAPNITSKEDILTTYVGKKIDLLSNVTATDNSLEEILVSVEGEYNIKKEGEYKLKYTASDSSNNKSEKEFVLKVVEDPDNRTFTTSKSFKAEVKDGVTYIDGTLIVNKTYSIPSSYGDGLTKEATEAFKKMREDASKEDINLYVVSGYRSYKTQKTIYNNYVKEDGKTEADTYSARPGHSEHQTGLAMDLNKIDDSFAEDKEGIWLNNNAYKYGFIIRYPKGKDKITGYIFEPWHVRYVGTDLAKKLYNNGNWITLEEYYGIDSKYSE